MGAPPMQLAAQRPRDNAKEPLTAAKCMGEAPMPRSDHAATCIVPPRDASRPTIAS